MIFFLEITLYIIFHEVIFATVLDAFDLNVLIMDITPSKGAKVVTLHREKLLRLLELW